MVSRSSQPAARPSARRRPRRRIATLSLWRGYNLEWRLCWRLRPEAEALVQPKRLPLVMALNCFSKNYNF